MDTHIPLTNATEIPAGLREAREADAHLPHQELCFLCSYDVDDMTGIPRDVVAITQNELFPHNSWDPFWGEPPTYDVMWLSCGHTIDWPH